MLLTTPDGSTYQKGGDIVPDSAIPDGQGQGSIPPLSDSGLQGGSINIDSGNSFNNGSVISFNNTSGNTINNITENIFNNGSATNIKDDPINDAHNTPIVGNL